MREIAESVACQQSIGGVALDAAPPVGTLPGLLTGHTTTTDSVVVVHSFQHE